MRRRRWLAAWLSAWVLVPLAAAQETSVPVPTPEEIRAELEELAGSEGGGAGAETYREALQALERAAEARARAQAFEAEASEAPGLLQSLKDELASPREAPLPELDASLALPELEGRLELAQAELAASRAKVDELARLADEREARKAVLPEEMTAATRALDEAREALEAAPKSAENEARRTLLAARIEEHGATLAALQAEQEAYEARRNVLPLRRDRARRRLAQAERVAVLYQDEVARRRAAEGETAAREAERRLEEVVERFPALGELARGNRELASMRSGDDGLPQRIVRAKERFEGSREQLDETQARYRRARRRVAAGGLTEGMGLTLRRDYEWLPDPTALEDQAEERDERLSEAQLRQIAIEEERQGLSEPDALERLLAGLDVERASEELLATAQQLLEARREAQEQVLEDLSALVTVLYEHEELASRLTTTVQAYRDFIEERILWVRSTSPNPVASIVSIPGHLVEVASALDAPATAGELLEIARARPVRSTAVLLALVALAAGRGYLRRKRAEMSTLVRSFRTDRYVYTLRALAQTVLLALPLPLAAWFLGGLAAGSTNALVVSVGGALREIALVALVLATLRGMMRQKGLGQAHFRWPPSRLEAVRRELRWFEPTALALGLVVLALDRQSTTPWSDSIGRASFVLAMLALAAFGWRLLHAESALWTVSPKSGVNLVGRTHRIWSRAAVALPVVLAVMALLGYYYTALELELRLRYSIAFSFALVLVNSLLLRWLYMARRRLAVNQALEARARRAEEQQADGASVVTESGTSVEDADKVDIPAIDAQTRELFRSSLILASVLGIYFIWAGVLPALQGLDRVQLFPELRVVSAEAGVAPAVHAAEPNGERSAPETSDGSSAVSVLPVQPLPQGAQGQASGLPSVVTLADVLLALIFVALTSVAAKNLPALLELSLLQRLPLDGGTRYAISTIIRYLIVLVGLTAISRALGIGWRQVQWLAAALTFGLAFGLQEIFANFVSGLIILIERPVRVGDVVTVGSTEGRVTQLRMRATTILDWDNREYLIPNKELITGSVINWTLSDPVTRVVLRVGIAYGSDTDKARKLMLDVVKANPLVLGDPQPSVIFRAFGDSTLDFDVRVFIASRDYWPQVVDRLHSSIDKAFRAEGVEIAFPQRDIHIRSTVEKPEGAS